MWIFLFHISMPWSSNVKTTLNASFDSVRQCCAHVLGIWKTRLVSARYVAASEPSEQNEPKNHCGGVSGYVSWNRTKNKLLYNDFLLILPTGKRQNCRLVMSRLIIFNFMPHCLWRQYSFKNICSKVNIFIVLVCSFYTIACMNL